MNFSDLDEIEQLTQSLLESGQVELKEHQIQKERDSKIQEAADALTGRLTPLLAQIESLIADYETNQISDSLNRKKLEQQADNLRQQLQDVELNAEKLVDAEFLRQEEQLISQQETQALTRWRTQLKADLLDLIHDQTDFYNATDTAIAIKGFIEDLKAIGALTEVVDALMAQINAYDRKASENALPTARLRGTYEQTLTFIADQAQRNRLNFEGRTTSFTPRRTQSSSRPESYSDLDGKVVIVGGHDRLETAIRNRFRGSGIELIWATTQTGPQIWAQAEQQILDADLVIVLTGYASHRHTEGIVKATKQCGKTPTYVNTTGMARLIEAIVVGLKSQVLSRQLKKPRTA